MECFIGISATNKIDNLTCVDYVTTQKSMNTMMMSPPKVEHKKKRVTALRSPLMKILDRSVETLGREL